MSCHVLEKVDTCEVRLARKGFCVSIVLRKSDFAPAAQFKQKKDPSDF